MARISPYHPQYYALSESEAWSVDPLLDDATRFAAARSTVGVGALMRRFRIGPVRARALLFDLDERRVLMSYLRGNCEVASINPHAWGALCASGRVDYVTNPGESLSGIAARQLGAADRWREVRDLNAAAFPGMGQHDYYPVGSTLKLPGYHHAQKRKNANAHKVPKNLRITVTIGNQTFFGEIC